MKETIPNGWKKEKLSDEIITPIAGTRPKGGVTKESGSIPSIGAEFITSDGRLHFKGMKYIEEEFYTSMRSGKLEVNDVLICKDGAWTGKVAFYDRKHFEKAAVNEHVFILRPKNDTNPKYIFYVLFSDSGQNQLKKIRTGSAQPGINTQFPKYFDIMLPTKKEQDKIVQILSVVDETLVETENVIQKNGIIKKEVMKKIFVKGMRKSKLKKTKVGEIPNDWELVTVNDGNVQVIDGDRGVNYPKQREFNEEGYCLFLNAGNVTKEGFRFRNKSYVTKEKDELLRKGKLSRHDVILTTRGTVGNIGYYDEDIPEDHIRINSGMVVLRSNGKIIPEYLYYAFRSYVLQKQIDMISFGSAQPQLTVKEINKFLIPLPPKEEQEEIIELVRTLNDKLNLEKDKKESLIKTKKGLLQKLLTGKICVKVD